MKILVVTQYYYPEPFRINEICEEFVRRGHGVTVLTGRPNYPDGKVYSGYENAYSDEVVNGVRVLRCKIRPRKTGSVNLLLNYLSFWYQASRKVRQLPDLFDVVYSYQLSPITSSKPACWYSKKYHKPHFLYCLDIWPESVIENISPNSIVFKYITWLSRKIYSESDKIGVTSPSFIDYLSKLTNWPQERYVYIPQHARDLQVVEKSFNDNCLNIVFTGNVGASQNLNVLIDAVELIKNEPGYKITIVGSGSDLERLKNKVSNEGLSEKIVFVGRQPKEKMPYYYDMADFCFLSLRDEGAVSWTIPGKLQEYMSAGKPILAAINGDARYVVNDAKCGVCVDFNDSSGLAKYILYYSKNKSDLTSFARNARNYYLNNFTISQHVDSLEKQLEIIVDNRMNSKQIEVLRSERR